MYLKSCQGPYIFEQVKMKKGPYVLGHREYVLCNFSFCVFVMLWGYDADCGWREEQVFDKWETCTA